MPRDYELMDAEAPLPYVRHKSDFKPDEVKFEFEHEHEFQRMIEKTRNDLKGDEEAAAMQVESYVETTRELKTRKVYIPTYGMTIDEDVESFFEVFEKARRALDVHWGLCSRNKDSNATTLFQLMDKMLVGTANTEWSDVVGEPKVHDWQTFKHKVSKFIATKVLPDDAYNEQLTYMQERAKPNSLKVKEWWTRIKTINRYLPYFFGTQQKMQTFFPNTDFRDWWVVGSLSEPELKRLVTNKIPDKWQRDFRKQDIGHRVRDSSETEDLVNHYHVLQTLEHKGRQRARFAYTSRTR